MKAPAMEVADVMRAFSQEYLSKYGDRMPAIHRKAIADITACRTPAMGGTTYYCPDCQRWQYSYHSCGNRNCNKCGHERAQQWLEQTGKLLLPTEHFMVTFTLPGKLRRLARSHQRLFYGLLMRLISLEGRMVSFRYQCSQSGRWTVCRLKAPEFIRRYLQHVLPRGFVKVRYYGLYAHRHRGRLNRLRHQLLPATTLQGESDPDKQHPGQEPEQPTAATTPSCRCCGKPMRMVEHIPRGGPWPHAPPAGSANHPGYRKPDLTIHHNVPVNHQ